MEPDPLVTEPQKHESLPELAPGAYVAFSASFATTFLVLSESNVKLRHRSYVFGKTVW